MRLAIASAAVVALAAIHVRAEAKPRVHRVEVTDDTVVIDVRFALGGRPVPRVHVGGPKPRLVDPSQLTLRPCRSAAEVEVLIARADARRPLEPVAEGVVAALGGLENARTRVVIVGATDPIPARAPLAEAIAGLTGTRDEVASSTELRLGLREAAARLAVSDRRIVVVVLEGTPASGVDEEVSGLVKAGIEVYALSTPTNLGGAINSFGVTGWGPTLAQAGRLVRADIDRCHRVFIPRRSLGVGSHRLELTTLDDSEIATVAVIVPPQPGAAAPRSRTWLWFLLGGGSVAILLGAFIAISAGRRPSGGAGTGPRGELWEAGPELGGVHIKAHTMILPSPDRVGRTLHINPVVVRRDHRTEVQPPDPGLAAWLVVYRAGIPRHTLVLQAVGLTTLGRSKDQAIQFDDETVSREHATVTAKAGSYVLQNLSQYGTKVDGRPVTEPVVLRDGMKLQLGATTLCFKCTR